MQPKPGVPYAQDALHGPEHGVQRAAGAEREREDAGVRHEGERGDRPESGDRSEPGVQPEDDAQREPGPQRGAARVTRKTSYRPA